MDLQHYIEKEIKATYESLFFCLKIDNRHGVLLGCYSSLYASIKPMVVFQ